MRGAGAHWHCNESGRLLMALMAGLRLLLLGAATASGSAVQLHVSCSAAGDCSARLQSMLDACAAAPPGLLPCTISFVPPNSNFRMEQPAAVRAAGVRQLALAGNGANLQLPGDAPFLDARYCTGITVANLTLAATRPAFTYGVVGSARASGSDGRVVLHVDMARYPMGAAAPAWTQRVDALHTVDPATFEPAPNGVDWIYNGATELQLRVDTAASTVSFLDRGFGLQPGDGVVLRHMLEFSRPRPTAGAPRLDSLVFEHCTDVVVRDVTIHNSPGMGVLAWDSTGVRLEGVRNCPPSAALPLASNADAMHLASCRGEVAVRNCQADRQGDDGLNIHSQYAIVSSVLAPAADSVVVTASHHLNADKTSWGVTFASPVFRVNDTVMVRRSTGLEILLRAVITRVQGSTAAPPLLLTLRGTGGAVTGVVSGGSSVAVGDVIESLSAVPCEYTTVVAHSALFCLLVVMRPIVSNREREVRLQFDGHM
eukprot:SAG11_NODE_2634_length_3150_cov_44.903966_4_plen_484_part_00